MLGTCSINNEVDDLNHYVIVRRDLSCGLQAANIVHAAGESADPKPEPGCRAVALHAKHEVHLRAIQARLFEAGIDHSCVVEGDGPHAGQLMAIGVLPSRERERIREVLGKLPLVR